MDLADALLLFAALAFIAGFGLLIGIGLLVWWEREPHKTDEEIVAEAFRPKSREPKP